MTEARARTLATSNIRTYGLSLMVLNDLADVDQRRHTAYIVTPKDASGSEVQFARVSGKRQVAQAVAAHVVSRLR